MSRDVYGKLSPGRGSCFRCRRTFRAGRLRARPFLGFLDLLPVAEGDDVEAALCASASNPARPCLPPAPSAPVSISSAILSTTPKPSGRLVPIVPARPAPRPADCIEAGHYPALVVGEAPRAFVERHAGDRRAAIADAGDHEVGGDDVGLAGTDRAAGFDLGALDLDAARPCLRRRARPGRRTCRSRSRSPCRRARSPGWRRSCANG